MRRIYTADAISQYGRALMEAHRTDFASFEHAAQAIAETFHREFTLEDGSPCFALVRIYRLTHFDELASELKVLVDPARQRWMTLMSTDSTLLAMYDARTIWTV